jgi:Ribbon-helix-helix protein, copG family
MTIELVVAVVRWRSLSLENRIAALLGFNANLISCVLGLGISSTAIGCTEICPIPSFVAAKRLDAYLYLPLQTLNYPVSLMNTTIMTKLTEYNIIPNTLPIRTRSMSLKQLNVKIPEQELRILEAFADKTERTKTDIIREFIRSLQAKI